MRAKGFAFLLCATAEETHGTVYDTQATRVCGMPDLCERPKVRHKDGKNVEISRTPRSCKAFPEMRRSGVLYKHSEN